MLKPGLESSVIPPNIFDTCKISSIRWNHDKSKEPPHSSHHTGRYSSIDIKVILANVITISCNLKSIERITIYFIILLDLGNKKSVLS